MANQDDLDLNVDSATAKRGRGRLWLIVAAVVLVLVAGGGAAFFLLSGEPGDQGEDGTEAVRPAIYKEIQPALVVNFQGPGRIRYVQVGVVLSSTDQGVIDAVDRHMPVIRNNLIMLLSDKSYEDLNTREGKERAREEVLDNVRAVLRDRAGMSGIDSVYFTSFVMQ